MKNSTHEIVRRTRGRGTTIQLSSSTKETSIVYGGNGSDTIIGGAGNDIISAGDGGTTGLETKIWAGSGSSLIYGGAGVDILYGGSGKDTLVAGTGTSTLVGKNGTEVMYASIGNATLSAGTGSDTLEIQTINLGAGDHTVYANANTVVNSSSGNDVINGAGFAYGGSGNDLFMNCETMIGGSGNDTFVGGVYFGTQVAGSGYDFMNGIAADYTVSLSGQSVDVVDNDSKDLFERINCKAANDLEWRIAA